MWSKTFGSENIMGRKSVTNKIRNGQHCISIKFIIDSQLSRLEQVKQWRQLSKVNQLLDILKRTSKPELFREDEKNVQCEQEKITKIGYLSEETDIDYGEMDENRQKEKQFRNKEDEVVAQLCEEINLKVSNSDILNSTFKSTASSFSMNHSGLPRFRS